MSSHAHATPPTLVIAGAHPRLYNRDLAPTAPEGRTWGVFSLFAMWMSDVHSVGGYTFAASLFFFGLTAEQVAANRNWYNPQWHYDNEPETRAALDLIFSDHFSRSEPGIFAPLRDTLLTNGDHYMHLADLKSYLEADQRLVELYGTPDAWTLKAILNVASSGKFSSDRTIAEYAADIWKVRSCPVR